MQNAKEIKAEIRRLRKIKRQLRAGTEQRLLVGRTIKQLKEKLQTQETISKDKEPLILEILKRDALLRKLDINLAKFTVEQLQKYLNKIKGKK